MDVKVRTEALELATMSAVPGAVAALARLNIFQSLHQAGPHALLTPQELASLALPATKSINLTYLARLLRLMAAKRILKEVTTSTGERRYSLEPIGRLLVDGAFLHLMLAFQAPALLSTWEQVHESVLDDSVAPFVRANGVGAWEYNEAHPEFGAVFNRAMAGLSEVYMRVLLDVYRGFSDVHLLVDVGGGVGSSLGLIVGRWPHLKGVNFDLHHVIATCSPLPGVEHVSGDMFKSVPSGDAIFMKQILHDWDDESCVKLLKNCYQALPANGKVIAVEHVLPEIIDFEGGHPMTIQADVQMLAFNTSGACERTEVEFRKLGLAAGFQQVKLICKVDDLHGVIEFHRSM